MTDNKLQTQFAPAEVATAEELLQQINLFAEQIVVRELIDAIPDIYLILNEQRQIVFANKTILSLVNVEDPATLYGLRPGEALNCIHAETESGCGTTEFCQMCGAVRAILSSLRGKEDIQECRISQRDGNSLDLQVWATPLFWEGKPYSIFTVKDIAHEKRRKALERIFFHDVLNTAGGLRGISELLVGAPPEELDQLSEMIHDLSIALINEIKTQRELNSAENNELEIHPGMVKVADLLQEVVEAYKNHEVAKGRFIQVSTSEDSLTIISDKTLLWRVIGNMTKNALEACAPGEAVTLGAEAVSNGVEFWVHNPSFMPREVQLQIFQRSFSTKGVGRGLGTYSIKLLSERYLNGVVSFTTSPASGTTFKARYPLSIGQKNKSPLSMRLAQNKAG